MEHLKILITATMVTLVPISRAEAGASKPNPSKGDKHMPSTTIVREATYIPFTAAPGQAEAVASLLTGAAAIVHDNEPGTLQWLSLRVDADRFAIVDFFAGPEGREAHFAGKVAAALKAAAPQAVKGGWDEGVVSHVENSKVLSYALNGKVPAQARLATRIDITAQAGRAEELAALLTGAGGIIKATEPGTLLWYALRIGPDRFAIFDVFLNEDGRKAHFAGKVAAALKANADALVEGGWDKGVVANIHNTTVISATW